MSSSSIYSPGYPQGSMGGGMGSSITTLIFCPKHNTMHGGVCQSCVTDSVFGEIMIRLSAISERMEKALEKLEAKPEVAPAGG